MGRTKLGRWAGLAAMLALALGFGIAQQQEEVEGASELPDGPGKINVIRNCSKCHGLDQFIPARHTKDEWDVLIDKMTEEGLDLSDREYEIVVGYLSKYLGRDAPPAKLHINKLTVETIEERLGLSDKEAEAIVKYRTENGPFKSWDDLMKVPGLDAKKLDSVRDLVRF